MLEIPNLSSNSDLRRNSNNGGLDPKRLSDGLGRSQSVRRTSCLIPNEGSGLLRSSSLRLPNSNNNKSNSGSHNNSGNRSAGGGFRRMSKFLHESFLGGENAKQEFSKLFEEQEFSQIEYRRLRHHLEKLDREYGELQASSNWLSKYTELKSIIKRSVMHLKVGSTEEGVSIGAAKEIGRKMEERYEELDSETLLKEKATLRDQIETNRSRISTLRSVFDDLDTQYTASKKYTALSRYQMMNALIKDLLSRPNVREML